MAGQPLGQWGVTVKRGDSTTEIDEDSSASLAGMTLSAKAALVLRADLSPASYQGSYRMSGQDATVGVELTSTAATVSGSQSAAPRTIPLQAGTHHFVVVEPGLLAGLFAVPAQLASWQDSSVTWLSPIMGTTQVIAGGAGASPARPPDVPAADVELSLTGQIPVTIWYDPTTFVPDRIEVPSQNAILRRVR